MTSIVQSPYTSEQITAWLRGLLTLAWADGNFDAEEQKFITALTHNELAVNSNLETLQPITAQELGAVLGPDPKIGENFLRTAVMVALADGLYSASEDRLLHEFCQALNQKEEILEGLSHTLYHPEVEAQIAQKDVGSTSALYRPSEISPDVLYPVREWLDGLEMHDPKLAHFLVKMIPAQCPFERDIKLFGHKIVHIPPLCKLNPLYDQLVGLRFRALSYLADECGEDVSQYC